MRDRDAEPKPRRCPDCHVELVERYYCAELGRKSECQNATKCEFRREINACPRCAYYEEV